MFPGMKMTTRQDRLTKSMIHAIHAFLMRSVQLLMYVYMLLCIFEPRPELGLGPGQAHARLGI